MNNEQMHYALLQCNANHSIVLLIHANIIIYNEKY